MRVNRPCSPLPTSLTLPSKNCLGTANSRFFDTFYPQLPACGFESACLEGSGTFEIKMEPVIKNVIRTGQKKKESESEKRKKAASW